MSNEHSHGDHDHDHEHHDHDHGHGHEHDHGHGHEHSHDKDADVLASLKAAKPVEPEEPAPVAREDTGTQALSEALKSSFWFVKILMLILIGGIILSCIRTVESNQVAVVLRFGRPVGSGLEQVRKPGAHFVMPYPIEELVTIPVGESHTVESKVGWYRSSAADEAVGREPDVTDAVFRPGVDGYTITADGYVIHARAILKYRVSDPIKYAFDFANVTNVVRDLLDNSILYASAHFTAENALYKDKTGFRDMVRDRVETGIAKAGLGITLEPINVETRPPLVVKAAFEEVTTAELERNRRITEANGTADQMLTSARGEADTIINAGITASNQLVQSVISDARYFQDQLPHYQKDPELFRKRLLAQSMERVLTNASDKFYLPSMDGKSQELRLLLSREPDKILIKQ